MVLRRRGGGTAGEDALDGGTARDGVAAGDAEDDRVADVDRGGDGGHLAQRGAVVTGIDASAGGIQEHQVGGKRSSDMIFDTPNDRARRRL